MMAEPPSHIQPDGHYLNFRRSPRRDLATLPDGRIGELFLDGGEVDALSEMARESAIVSLALADGAA